MENRAITRAVEKNGNEGKTMKTKELIKDLIFWEQQVFSEENYNNEELTRQECELLDKYIESFCNKLELLIEEVEE